MKLWHCRGARSLRALWALEEMGMDYELEVMPFPPRMFNKDYIETNVIGTVPYFVDGEVRMTESSGICQYLVERYQRYDFGLKAEHAEYGDYLNWLFHSDATLTFPQTIAMRYFHLEPTPEKQPVAIDYGKWFYARLRLLDQHLADREYLVDNRFTVADIAVGYALYLADTLKLGEMVGREFTPQVSDYLARLRERPAFQRADAFDEPGK
ncbi:glutathione S-transferase family protein [Halieaceae bacterium IMCC14734]|uniref:Glutathione S-transferase family protein n=1 Tax=Candidatus Litorirhabdus singularis TaxID=2518993 RepID=A0ABT3TFS1_9GAMM|nr:glutathione S-transferase family protein [Candidatus Litorirhabdus singularis]MCX2981114.1 glutathione S-transferase family protein [Candidatus Litorirhabdus singularis]